MFAAWRAWGGRGRLSRRVRETCRSLRGREIPSVGQGKGRQALCGGISCRASAGMSPKSVDSCQKARFSVQSRVRMTGRKDGNRSRSVKKQVGELSVWSISPPWRAFPCGKNGISLLKEIFFLPQRRKFPAAKKFSGVWKTGKNGASDGFFLLNGGRLRAKPLCPFATLSLHGLTRERYPSALRSVAGGKVSRKPRSGFHSAFPGTRKTRIFPSVPVLASVRAILVRQVLTF